MYRKVFSAKWKLYNFVQSMNDAYSCRNFILFVLIQVSPVVLAGNFGLADSLKTDSVVFKFADVQFDSTDNVLSYKSSFGYEVKYPKEWVSDKRAGANLILYLRPYDAKSPSTFREMLTIIREPVEDASKSLKNYVFMQNTINENTWQKYNIRYEVMYSEAFDLHGTEAFQVFCTLKEVSQQKLLIIFMQNKYAYKIEYTSTNVTYTDYLKQVRKVVNSFEFTQ